MRSLAWAGVVLVSAMPVIARQAGPFRVGSNTVAVYATVLDRSHHLVTDLTAGDFEVQDNGKRVDVAVFSADPMPITAAVLLDTSGSMRETLPVVVSATEQLIDRFGPHDAVKIGAFGQRTIFSTGFTSTHGDLLRFLHTQVRAGGDTPLWNAVDIAMVYLKDIAGRRVVVVFTDGFDTTSLEHGYKAVIARADSEEVMVYGIGCWGGPDSGDQRPDADLRKLAERSGGGYTELTWDQSDQLADTFARIADELHHQYVIGFTPAVLDGKVHHLDVKVRRPGLTVRARQTYQASR